MKIELRANLCCKARLPAIDLTVVTASSCAPVAQRLEQQTHNLLVRGSNPCGGTNQLTSSLTLTASCCWADRGTISRWREDGAIWEVRDRRVMRSVPSAVADRFDDPDTLFPP